MMRSFVCAFVAITLFAAPAAAQDHRVFANVNFGTQSQSQDVRQTATFSIYDETGNWQVDHAIESGRFIDAGAGFRVFGNFFVGASFTQGTKQTRDVTVTASVPSPIFTDTFRNASGSASGLEHKERALHLQALLHVPVTVEFGVTLFGGPSFFTVEDQLVESITTVESADFSSVSINNINVAAQSNTATGFHVGLDAQYMFVKNAGIGGMLRFSKGSVDLTAPASTQSETLKIDAGGLEIGAGLRFRF